jgi:predicted enzyme related to lactoylglutathione lyase/catechol 2,3-dioxygenase-like lactoylglutathione lyase family enzyme
MAAMTETGTLELAAFDTTDAQGLAKFYADLTGWAVVRDVGDWVTIEAPDGQQVGFQQVAEHLAPQWPGQEKPQQFHLDLTVDGIEAAADRAVGLGATRLATGTSWITLADPAGHPFDLCQRDGQGADIGIFAVTIDAPDASALARFYADLLGMEVTYDGPEGSLVAGGGKSLMFQQVGDYTAPQWPDPAHPQQAHLDVMVEDLEGAEARALALGATRISDGGDGWRTMADPAGHPFDLTTG